MADHLRLSERLRHDVAFATQRGRPLAFVALAAAVLGAAMSFAQPVAAQNVDWLVNIDDSADPVPAGSVVDYLIEVSNNGTGPADAPPTQLAFDVPATTELVGIVDGSGLSITNCTPVPAQPAGTTVTCDVPALAPAGGSTASFAVQLRMTQAAFVQFEPTVLDTSPGIDTDLGNNTEPEPTTVNQGADLGIDLSLPATAPSGSRVPVTLTVENFGPDDVSDYRVEFPAPVGLADFTSPAGCSFGGGTFTCDFTSVLAVGDTLQLDFTGQIVVSGGSQINASAGVTANSPLDGVADNNTDAATLDVTAGTDLTVGIARNTGANILTGEEVVFALSPAYTGDEPTDIVVTHIVPAEFQIDNIVVPAGWVVLQNGNDLTFTRPDGFGSGADVSLGDLTIETTAIAAGTATSIVNIATTGAPADSNLSNNSDSLVTTIVDPFLDLVPTKTGPSPALAVVNQPYTFEIGVTNNGNAPFNGTITLTDTIPAGMRVDSFTDTPWTCILTAAADPATQPSTLECTLVVLPGAPLGDGASTPDVTVNITPLATGILRNSVGVSSTGNLGEGNTANDSFNFDLDVSNSTTFADIAVTKAVTGSDPLDAGELQTYELELINNDATNTAFDVVLTDVFRNLRNSRDSGADAGFEGFTIVRAGTATNLSCSSVNRGGRQRTLTCEMDSLAPCTAGPAGDCPIITAQVRHGNNATTVENEASIISNLTADPNLANNSDSTSFTQNPIAEVTIEKTVTPTRVPAGQPVVFDITGRVANTGLSNADDFTIVDTLPAGLRFLSISTSGSCSGVPSANQVLAVDTDISCTFGSVPNGQQRTIRIEAQPTNALADPSDTVTPDATNTALVSTSTPELGTLTNQATVGFDVIAPRLDLLVNKTDDADPLTVGDQTIYRIVVDNAGPSASENIVVTDTLPPNRISFQSVSIDAPGTCLTQPAPGAIGGTLECQFPFLAAGDDFEIRVTVEGEVKGSTTNTVSISSDEIVAGWEDAPANNQTVETTSVRTRTDVFVDSKTPDLATVALEDPLIYTIRVNVDATQSEADDVELTDNLPTGMVLRGTPTPSVGLCMGMAGGTSFSCALGTINAGGSATITVPVEVITVTSNPQRFDNTASVTTSSFDVNLSNNSNTGSVDVTSASLAGTVYRDFADDGTLNGSDTGIDDTRVRIIGTSSGGRSINRTVRTDANGDYLFDLLPAGTYEIRRLAVNEPNLDDGRSIVTAPNSGTSSSADRITSISLADNEALTDYDFTVIPQATIGLAKVLSGQGLAIDGSFTADFELVVENLSLERLINISVTDTLAGGSPLFGTLVTPGDPLNDPLSPGVYTITTAPGGTCGGLQAGFDGSGTTTLASGFALDPATTCTITFSIRVQPTDPLPPMLGSGGEYENQANVTGTGNLSSQVVTDTSDDGSVPDTDGDRIADEAEENDPTPVPISLSPGIALIKTADISALSTPPAAGDIVTYRFEVTNTGNVTLTNVTVADPLPGVVINGNPIPSLSPGATDTTGITATYALTQADVDAGTLDNQATVSGKPPSGTDVTDPSGTTFSDDTPTSISFAPGAGIALVKTADTSALSDPPQIGETLTYRFAVTNTGNVTLTNVTITEALAGVVLSGNPIAALAPGETNTTTITGTYILQPDDLTAGEVINTADVAGTPPTGPPVTATSNVTTPIPQVPGLDLEKTLADQSALADGAQAGDTIRYAFEVRNTGNVPLRDVTVNDALPGVVLSGGPIPLMNPTAAGDGTDVDSTTFTASYTLTAEDAASFMGITNTATASATWGTSESPATIESEESAVTVMPPDPTNGLSLVKTAPEAVVRRGSPVPFVIQLRNDNPFATQPLDLRDTLPMGLVYIADSATIDGVPWPVTVIEQTVIYPDVIVPAGTEIVATLEARVLTGTNPGFYTNSVTAFDPIYGLVAGPATATVRLLPEAVFDCSDVIGRVFDDLDGDGYQDPYDPDARPELTDKVPGEATRNEVGLAGVRLVTLDGLVITTDANGLFSVPCASLPRDRGSNFLLSLDERTLPLGFEMTTENPRVMRLTPGMLTEMNFGARLAQSIRVDLSAAAFTDGAEITLELRDGIAAMVAHLAQERVGVDLVFHLPAHADAESVASARANMAAVADEIARQWSEVGQGRLTIGQSIARAGGQP